MSDIIIADRLTDANQRLIPNVSDLKASWAINEPGQLSFAIPLRDLQATGVDHRTLLGKWLHYTHPTAGPWGGLVTNLGGTDGILTINAQSWLAALRGWLWDEAVAGSGNMATMLTRMLTALQGKTGISTSTTFDLLSIQQPEGTISGDILDSVLPAALEASLKAAGSASLLTLGYTVDPVTRVFSFKTLGTDKRATVDVNDGDENLTSNMALDRDSYGNTVRLTARYRAATLVTVGVFTAIDQAAAALQGPVYIDVDQTADAVYPSGATATAAAQAILARHRGQQGAVFGQQSLVSIESADERGVWGLLREGDVITAALGLAGLRGPMLVRYRALDDTRPVMTFAGEAELIDPANAPLPPDPPPVPTTATFQHHIAAGMVVTGIAIDGAANLIDFVAASGDARRYNDSGGAITTIAPGYPIVAGATDIAGGGSFGAGTTSYISRWTSVSSGAVEMLTAPSTILTSPDTGWGYGAVKVSGGFVYAASRGTSGTRGLRALRATDLTIATQTTGFYDVYGIAAIGRLVWILNQATRSVMRFNHVAGGALTFDGHVVNLPLGTGPGQFGVNLGGMDQNSGKHLVISDPDNNRVQVFGLFTGAYLGEFGAPGSGAGQLSNPGAIACLGNTVAVADRGNIRISVWVIQIP